MELEPQTLADTYHLQNSNAFVPCARILKVPMGSWLCIPHFSSICVAKVEMNELNPTPTPKTQDPADGI